MSLWQQYFKRNLFLNWYREGKKYIMSLFPPATEERDEKMSDTRSLSPPLGDPWASCLLPTQDQGAHTGH